MDDDGVGAIRGVGDDDPLHVVAGVPFVATQALMTAAVQPLVAVVVGAVGGDDLQVQVVDPCLVRRGLAGIIGSGQGDAGGGR